MRLDYLRPLVLIAVVACGGDDDGAPDDDGGSDDGAAADASPADAGGGDGGADAASEMDGGATGDVCGGLLSIKCLETHFCDWEPDSCGAGDKQGVCMPRPRECVREPGLCGCDGQRYEGECEAHKAGVDVAEIGICDPAAP